MSVAPASSRIDARTVSIAAWAVFVVFMLNGFNFASWASRLPAIRTQLGFSELQMGTLLLFMALGSLVALPLSGWIMSKFGAKRTIITFASLNVVGYLTAAFALASDQPMLLRVALVAVGAGTGVWDAAMNLEGAIVEQHLGRTLMPRLHAGFSFGTIVGSGVGTVMAFAKVDVTAHLSGAVVIGFLLLLVTLRGFLSDDVAGVGALAEATPAQDAKAPSVLGAWLEPRTLMIGLIVLASAITEGSANDWVGLAVVDGFEQNDAMGATALTVFLTAMTGMRLLGTGLLDRFGRVTVLRLVAVLAFVGLATFALSPWLWLSFVGVVIWGLGAALGFPVGMSAAADDPVRAAARVSSTLR